MKTQINLLLIGLLLYVSEAGAQTYYYNTTKTFSESGYTYQCDLRYGAVVLYNKANQFTYANQIFKNSGSIVEEGHWDDIDDVQMETWTRPLARTIVNNAFTAAEKSRLKGESFGITMIISPETGKVIEVNFDFNPYIGYGTVPVSTYRKIETDLKAQIWFTPTTEGKKVNYLMRFWRQEVK